MRLLFVHDRFGAMAGAEVNVQLTAAEFKNRGHTLALLHGPPTGKGEATWNEIFSDRFPLSTADDATNLNSENDKCIDANAHISSSDPSAPFRMVERVVDVPERRRLGGAFALTRNAIEAFQPDAIYVHKISDLDVLGALAESPAPVVRMVHDHDLYCMRSYKYFPLTRTICTRAAGLGCIFPCGAVIARNRNGGFPLKWMSYRAKQRELALNRRFCRMIVATDYMKRELIGNGFHPRQIEIHAPVPRDNDRATQASFSDSNRIIYSGQIIRGKGVDVLIEALARVRVPFECFIFGDGNHRSFCEALSYRLGLSDRVYFKGYLPPVELEKFYTDASLAVVSSTWPEPFGAVGLEAMRHGLPVVAFDAGGIREWLINGENGFLVPWMNRAEYAAKIEQLLRDKTLARGMGKRGHRFAEEKFGFERYISGLEEMFARVIGETQPQLV